MLREEHYNCVLSQHEFPASRKEPVTALRRQKHEADRDSRLHMGFSRDDSLGLQLLGSSKPKEISFADSILQKLAAMTDPGAGGINTLHIFRKIQSFRAVRQAGIRGRSTCSCPGTWLQHADIGIANYKRTESCCCTSFLRFAKHFRICLDAVSNCHKFIR